MTSLRGTIFPHFPVNAPMPLPKASKPMSRIIYLAGPYTHASQIVKETRVSLLTRAAAKLISQGHIVFSPITMTHPIDVVLAGQGNTLGSAYWVKFDEAFMDICSEMMVLRIDGWERSSGIRRETAYFTAQGKRVSYLRLEDLGL